ncbi:MAG: hypothetical protein C4K47_10060 [Candidatus Thorarchaeota archaeon]|nr:MAG: hypothetical protein C4K47_10060 [Candidatus Thorarchaeota archaeon]
MWLSGDCSSLNEIVEGLKKQRIETGLLLVQDGVFQADKGNPVSKGIQKLGVPVHVSRIHVMERGISDRLIPGVDLVSYSEMVDLIMDGYDRMISL